jgi:hypothetical protein
MTDKPQEGMTAEILEIAATGAKAVAIEASDNAVTGKSSVDLMAMNRPGTMIWTDPRSGEVRYTPPGDRMYSTATMYAEHYIDKDGNKKEML